MKKELNGKGWLGMKRAGNKTLKRSQLQQILQILVTKEARNETLGGATDSELLKVYTCTRLRAYFKMNLPP